MEHNDPYAFFSPESEAEYWKEREIEKARTETDRIKWLAFKFREAQRNLEHWKQAHDRAVQAAQEWDQ